MDFSIRYSDLSLKFGSKVAISIVVFTIFKLFVILFGNVSSM